ncbi:MAG TPA: hypothetical protein VFX20_13925 [Steroidobacteraceae bacterium]|nr:hypothetical protein [Steroidobacteraceae bacterium]
MSTVVTPGYTAAGISSEARRTQLMIRTLLLGARFATPVKVIAVHPGEGSPPAIGTVDVQPLVQIVDGDGKLWPMGLVYGVPFARLQAGGTAVVIDPVVDDIGLAVACDRDISSVMASGGQLSGPGSARTNSVSDLVYVASILSTAETTQYLLMNPSGITLLSPQRITIQAPQINIVGAVTQSEGDVSMASKLTVPNVDATTDVTVPNGSVNGHVHSDPQGGRTGPMTG